ncbi:MAG: FUSC family membrane protein [Pedobacter sp.]|uniref:FUSC family membrane protein n=1 Tax=Pedobacter sp. TaxID=1411316 RepID=UPI002806D2B5|nr:FUSC family membrane protein [Pedobacter sp.]MDQ8005327.1 FUSC family membrane protein [Pedobacter sp.]
MLKQIENYLSRAYQLLKSEHTVDALRNTLSVILPIIFFYKIDWPTTGIGVGIGALMICMTDLPGNRADKFKAAWISILIFSIVAILTAWSTSISLMMIVVVVTITFLLTMSAVLGQRMAAIGLMGIILATFTIGLKPKDPLLYANYIFWGGVWYYLISLLQISVFPYRSLNRAIAQAERETSALLRLRAQGYNSKVSLSGFNQSNMRLHLKLASSHELIRQLLLSDRKAVKKLNPKVAAYLEKSIHLIDLYEQVSAVHYDYPYLRRQFENTGALPLIQQSIQLLAKLLTKPNHQLSINQFEDLHIALIQKAETLEEGKKILLRQILANIDEIYALIKAIHQPQINNQLNENTERYRDFLTLTPVQAKTVKSHFSLSSPIFRFALRLSALCLVAMILIAWLTEEHYSYWLLLTMVIVSRPSYGQTMKRNAERIGGTAIGLLIGWSLSQYADVSLQLYVSVIGLFGFFAFNRVAYSISAVCITVAVILCLNVYDGNLWRLVSDRALFTIVGVTLCLGATFVFPIWNAPRLSTLIADVVKANLLYFKAVVGLKPDDLDTVHQTRLARKLSHQQLSALSEAIQAAQKEPLKKQLNWSLIKRLQLFNYQFNVLTATFSGLQKQGGDFLSKEDIKSVEENLEQFLSNINELDLKQAIDLPAWGDQPLHLLEVSNYLASIQKNS